MLSKIYIDGFRHFQKFDLDLGQGATLLCGLNGTGKSSIVEIMYRLKQFLGYGMAVDELCPQRDVPIWANNQSGKFQTRFCFNLLVENDYRYEVEITHCSKSKNTLIGMESLSINGQCVYESTNGRVIQFFSSIKQDDFPVNPRFSGINLLAQVNSSVGLFLEIVRDYIFAISLNPCAMTAFFDDKEKNLDFDGSNFSAWYAWLKNIRLKDTVEALEDIGQFFPNFNQFDFIRHGAGQELVALINSEGEQAYNLSFDCLSQGQKALCLFYMLLRTCPTNSTILVDELENHVSIIELQPFFDVANEEYENRNIQFIFVSHNPKTLNWYQEEAIILETTGSPAAILAKKYVPEKSVTLEDRLWLEKGA